jgi:broad specificity phosphatase PhoE
VIRLDCSENQLNRKDALLFHKNNIVFYIYSIKEGVILIMKLFLKALIAVSFYNYQAFAEKDIPDFVSNTREKSELVCCVLSNLSKNESHPYSFSYLMSLYENKYLNANPIFALPQYGCPHMIHILMNLYQKEYLDSNFMFTFPRNKCPYMIHVLNTIRCPKKYRNNLGKSFYAYVSSCREGTDLLLRFAKFKNIPIDSRYQSVVIVMRHGPTNAKCILGRKNDMPISGNWTDPDSINVLELFFRNGFFNQVFTGSSCRAMQTAVLMTSSVTVNEQFDEQDLGIFEGIPTKTAMRNPELISSLQNPHIRPTGGEIGKEVAQRAMDGINRALNSNSNQNVLIVASRAFMMHLTGYLKNCSLSEPILIKNYYSLIVGKETNGRTRMLIERPVSPRTMYDIIESRKKIFSKCHPSHLKTQITIGN